MSQRKSLVRSHFICFHFFFSFDSIPQSFTLEKDGSRKRRRTSRKSVCNRNDWRVAALEVTLLRPLLCAPLLLLLLDFGKCATVKNYARRKKSLKPDMIRILLPSCKDT